jgi:hypothetical protein
MPAEAKLDRADDPVGREDARDPSDDRERQRHPVDVVDHELEALGG